MVDPARQKAEWLRNLQQRVSSNEQKLRGESIPRQLNQVDEGVRISDSLVVTETAVSAILIDDFEDNSLSEYNINQNSSGAISTNSFEGSYSLTTTSFDIVASTPGNGLPNYPSQGDRFRTYVKGEGGDGEIAPTFLFGVQDTSNYYQMFFLWGDDFENNPDARLDKIENGNQTVLDSIDDANTVSSLGTWRQYDVDWQSDGTITVSLMDSSGNTLYTMSAVDSTFTSGGVGLSSDDGGYLDYIRLI